MIDINRHLRIVQTMQMYERYRKSKAILQASSVHESEEASQYWGPTMVTDDAKLDLELFQPKKMQ